MQGPGETFRMSYWWLLGYVVAVATSIAVPVALAMVLIPGLPVPPGVLLFAVAVGVGGGEICAALLLLAFVAYFTIRVGPDAVSGFSPWGVYRTVAWGDILSVRRRNILGMKYLRTCDAAGKALVSLPLFLSNRDRFYRVLRVYAGPDHPLVRALHEDMTTAGEDRRASADD